MEEIPMPKKIPPVVEMKQKELNMSAKKIVDLLQESSKLENKLSDHEKKVKETEQQTNELEKRRIETEKQLEIEKKKAAIYQIMQEFLYFNAKLEESFSKKDYKSMLDYIRHLEQIALKIRQTNTLAQIKTDSAQKLKLLFNDIVNVKEKSISFPSDTKFVAFHETLKYLDSERSFIQFIVNIVNNELLTTMHNQNCNIVVKNLGNRSITLSEREEPHTPMSALTESCKLIQELQNALTAGKFKFEISDLQIIGNTALEFGISQTGGLLVDTEKAANQLCKLCHIDSINMNDLAKQSKLPQTLERCRKLMREGKLFGDSVNLMMSIFEGTPSEGILTKLAVLALVEWKDDAEKLKTAFPIFIAMGTNESLQCMMMFQKRIDELKSLK